MSTRAANSPALLALTASALAALGGRVQAQGVEAPQVDYRYSAYREAPVPRAQTVNGAGSERYAIDTHQFRVAVPMDAFDLTTDVTLETMSGASPLYVMPGADGRPLQVMSGASIEEKRGDVLLSLTRRQDQSSGSLSAGYSDEDDYRAANLGLQGEHRLDDTVTTLSLGAGYSDDTLNPTQGQWPTSVREAARSAASAFVGYARVLDAVTVVQSTLSYTLHDGFLADPYKQAYIADTMSLVPDARPDQRGQLAWLTRLRRFFKSSGGALHADYRYYHDDWEVDAHTVDLSFRQRLGSALQIVPGVRYYSQSQAYFYDPYYREARSDGLASSDYRLSPYGALSGSLAALVEVAGWGASLRYEVYDSDADYALGDVRVGNPGLVDFEITSLSLKKVF